MLYNILDLIVCGLISLPIAIAVTAVVMFLAGDWHFVKEDNMEMVFRDNDGREIVLPGQNFNTVAEGAEYIKDQVIALAPDNGPNLTVEITGAADSGGGGGSESATKPGHHDKHNK